MRETRQTNNNFVKKPIPSSSSRNSTAPKAVVTKNNNNNNKTSTSKSAPVLIAMGDDCQGWYDIGQKITGRNDTVLSLSAGGGGGGGNNPLTATTQIDVSAWRQTADDLYAQEVYNFTNARKLQSTADDRWIEGTMSKGTMKDKIAAMSIVIANNPFHKLSTLDALLNLASSSMKGTATTPSTSATTTNQQQARIRPMAIEALTDLFLHTLLPPHRNLIPLTHRPLHLYADTTSTTNHTTKPQKINAMAKKTLSPKVLLLWRYEELLKQRYQTFLRKVLNQEMLLLQSSSTTEQLMEGQKIIALRTVITLLKERSECEGELLSMAVNKIGDPNRKVASAASYLLHSQLLTQHPAMTMVVAKEVQNLAFRPHLSSRALYNCIIFLNQLRFTDETSTTTTTTTTSNNNNKTNTLPQQLVQTYFKLFEIAICSTSTTTSTTTKSNHKKNSSGKNNKKQRKNHKKRQKTGSSSSLSTSSTMEKVQSRLLCALLTGVNRARPFLPKSDQKMDQYVDSIYRVAHQAPPSASTQALLLLFHLTVDDTPSATTTTSTTKQQQQDRLYRVIYSKISDPAMYTGKHVTMFLNLIYKSMKYDTKDTRIVAFAKRLLQTTMSQSSGVGIVAGTIFLLSEVIKYKPILQYCIETNISNTTWDNTAREPTYAFKKEHNKEKNNNTTNNNNNNNDDDEDDEKNANDTNNPNGETDGCSIWELSMLLFHFHPSVVKFSETIGSITYDGDPTRNFTLSSFLDRFAYRQPKKAKEETAENKRLFVQGPGRRRRGNTTDPNSFVPLNDPSLLQQKPTNIAEEDKFFYRYFEERARRDEKKGIARNIKKLSAEEYQDEEDDNELEAIYAREKSNLDYDVS